MIAPEKMDRVVEELGLIARSDPFMQVLETIRQVADTNITVLITGESGTGKELIAKAIHRAGPRNAKPLVSVNCGAIPEGILESELFGHEKGAFTGAAETRKGYFEIADGGTLFLDEIGEMPTSTQVKLLRVIEEREFMRVGGSKQLQVDVRLIAATNKLLDEAVKKGEFRKDLFYRLNAVNIQVPPLRSRKDDIRPLALHFAAEVCKENKIEFKGISESAFAVLEEYSWPGNIRELHNIIERSVVLEKGSMITGDMVQSYLGQGIQDRNLPVVTHKTADQVERELIYRVLLDLKIAIQEIRNMLLGHLDIVEIDHRMQNPVEAEVTDPRSDEEQTLRGVERQAIIRMLEKYRGNRKKASRALGIGERTLYRKIKEYRIENQD